MNVKLTKITLSLMLLLLNISPLHIQAEADEDVAEKESITETFAIDETETDISEEIPTKDTVISEETENFDDKDIFFENGDAEDNAQAIDNTLVQGQTVIDLELQENQLNEEQEPEDELNALEENEDNSEPYHSYTASYKTWSQGASDYASVRAAGCAIVALAKLIVEAGIDTSSSFNPDVFAKWEQDNGYIPYLGTANDYNINQTSWNAPVAYANAKGKTLTYKGQFNNPSEYDLWTYVNAGYLVIINVNFLCSGQSGTHFVMIDNASTISKGTLYCYDSYSSTTAGSTDFKNGISYNGYTNWNSYSAATAHVYQVGSTVDTEVSLSFTTNSVSNEWLNGAFTFTANANQFGQFTAGGVRVYRDGYSDDVSKFGYPDSYSGTSMQFAFTVTNYYYSFAPGKKYWYQYYAIFNGTEYQSDWYSMTTSTTGCADLGDDFYATISTSEMYLYYGYDFLSASGNSVGLGADTDAGAVWHFVKQSDGAYKLYNVRSQGILSSSNVQAISNIYLKKEGNDLLDEWYISGTSGNYYLRNAKNTDLVICQYDNKTALLYGSNYKKPTDSYGPLKLTINKVEKPGNFTLNVTTDCNSDHDTQFSWVEPTHASGFGFHYALHISNVVDGEEKTFADIDPLSVTTYIEELPKGLYIAYVEAVSFVSTSSNKVSFEVTTGVDYVHVTDISFNSTGTTSYLYSGIDPALGTHADEIALQYIPYTITPSWASNQNVKWTSDNESCISIDEKNQVLKLNGVGTANITVTTEDGAYSSTKTILVEFPSKASYWGVGFTAIPGTATEETKIIWGYSNNNIAANRVVLYKEDVTTGSWEKIIDEDVVDAHSYSVQLSSGNYYTYVATKYSADPNTPYIGFNAEYNYHRESNNSSKVFFNIQDDVLVSNIILSKQYVSLSEGEKISLTAEIEPENATNKKVIWSSSDESVATVDANGLVTALKAGNAIISALADDESQVSASCTVTVNEKELGENTAIVKGVSVEGTTVSGTEIRVPVELTANPGFISGALSVMFDKNIFELTGVEFGIVPDYSSAPIENALNGSYLVQFGDDTKVNNYSDTGTLFTLVFKVKDGAEAGDYTLTIDALDGMWVDKDAKEVAAEVQDECTITLSDYLVGDLNSDGKVNATDRMLLVRYLAKWDGYEEKISNMKAADIDKNGTVNASDRVILVRYLAKWGGIYDTYFN